MQHTHNYNHPVAMTTPYFSKAVTCRCIYTYVCTYHSPHSQTPGPWWKLVASPITKCRGRLSSIPESLVNKNIINIHGYEGSQIV